MYASGTDGPRRRSTPSRGAPQARAAAVESERSLCVPLVDRCEPSHCAAAPASRDGRLCLSLRATRAGPQLEKHHGGMCSSLGVHPLDGAPWMASPARGAGVSPRDRFRRGLPDGCNPRATRLSASRVPPRGGGKTCGLKPHFKTNLRARARAAPKSERERLVQRPGHLRARAPRSVASPRSPGRRRAPPRRTARRLRDR